MWVCKIKLFLISNEQKYILIAPLDWGLGHTTRCVPVIRHLLSLGQHVIFAGNASQRRYISDLFPGLEQVHLKGYNVRYTRSKSLFMLRLLLQLPRLLRTIRQEHDWLERLLTEKPLAAVISDNRYGLHNKGIPSVIITHQLEVRSGLGRLADGVLRRLHYRYLSRFDACWVADAADPPGLSGRMAHPGPLPPNTRYLGLLSQLHRDDSRQEGRGSYLLVLLSGPEPQRSMLAKLLWKQLSDYPGPVVFVEGSDQVEKPAAVPEHITWHQRVSGPLLDNLITEASLVVCRSGYSTLMDLVALRKKAIVIPTPGQTEQEYLASHLHDQGVFLACKQEGFNLRAALDAAAFFPFSSLKLAETFELHRTVLSEWTDELRSKG